MNLYSLPSASLASELALSQRRLKLTKFSVSAIAFSLVAGFVWGNIFLRVAFMVLAGLFSASAVLIFIVNFKSRRQAVERVALALLSIVGIFWLVFWLALARQQ